MLIVAVADLLVVDDYGEERYIWRMTRRSLSL